MPKVVREPRDKAHILHTPLTLKELEGAIAWMKGKKAPDLNEIRTEQIKNFGQQTKRRLLEMYNNCIKYIKIPVIRRKSLVIALIKLCKQPTEAKDT